MGEPEKFAHHQQEAIIMVKAIEKTEALTPEENRVPIAKPGEFDLDKFKAKKTATVANVGRFSRRYRCTTSRQRRILFACIPIFRTIGRIHFVSWTCRSRAKSATLCI